MAKVARFEIAILGGTNERCTLGVDDTVCRAVASEETVQGLQDPESGEDGKDERGPVYERRRVLVVEHGPERPGDGNATSKITFRRREGIGS